MNSSQPVGKAYLVGAGPGDPGLLTIKAQRILASADVVLYDYLVDARILAGCSNRAEMVDVGKSGVTGHKLSQAQTEALMIEYCLAGRTVCRLKGGDPYLFGRGGEEGQHLAQAGIPFEVVPGITSAFAAPAYAGIPVTHRDYASMVSVITGHTDPGKPDSGLDWSVIAQIQGTLVFLMGVQHLAQIVGKLVQYGKPPQTPIALVRWGTRPVQQCFTGTLETIVDTAAAHGVMPPCVIVIGEVVALRAELDWFETLPLFGQTIVTTRARKQASQLRLQLEALGATVIEFPTIVIEPVEDAQPIRLALAGLAAYDWVVFTSPNAVEQVFDHLKAMPGADARSFAGCRIAAIGPATANALVANGIRPDLIPTAFIADAVYPALAQADPELPGKRVLLPCARIARDDVAVALEQVGVQVTRLPVYETFMPTDGPDVDSLAAQLEHGQVDMITFSSASTAENFAARLKNFLNEKPDALQNVCLAAIGPTTSQAVQTFLGRVDVEADVATIPGLVAALCRYAQQSATAIPQDA